jgi:hypothetical protein
VVPGWERRTTPGEVVGNAFSGAGLGAGAGVGDRIGAPKASMDCMAGVAERLMSIDAVFRAGMSASSFIADWGPAVIRRRSAKVGSRRILGVMKI